MITDNTISGLSQPIKPVQLPNKANYETDEQNLKSVVRFVTFNVNSVSTVLQYFPMTKIVGGMRNLNTLFNWMEADIICLQELKICNPILTAGSVNTMGGAKHLQQYGILSDYKCFITLPKLKKNYSGVGMYIRNSLPIKVVKVEEGITGLLPVNNMSISDYTTIENNGKNHHQIKHLDKKKNEIDSYRTLEKFSIGSYENLDSIFNNDIARGLELDNQGRCIVTEFDNGLVVIGCYIPANSIFSEEGLLFKMQYLKLVFQRVENLQRSGKTVILLGDLNVCKDIIDRAESLTIASQYFSNNTESDIDPQLNYEFIKETPERFLFNQHLKNSNFKIENNYKGSLLDTTRYKNPKRTKMYTCWNTLTNARSVNYGSRLDYILISKNYKANAIKVLNSDILPEIQGSDHCPVFTDFEISCKTRAKPEGNYLKFECKSFYKLINNDIMKMFGTKKLVSTSGNMNTKGKNKVVKWKQPTSKSGTRIDGFFKKKSTDSNENLASLDCETESTLEQTFLPAFSMDPINDLEDDVEEDSFLPNPTQVRSSSSAQRKDLIQQKLDSMRTDVKINKQQKRSSNEALFVLEDDDDIDLKGENNEIKRENLKKLLHSSNVKYTNIPLCRHNEKAIVKVSQKKGKEFWCCNKPLVISDANARKSTNLNILNPDYSCGFFRWVT